MTVITVHVYNECPGN